MATQTVTVLFTDLVRSTELLSRLGDAAADELRREHYAELRAAVADAGGHVRAASPKRLNKFV